MADIVYIEQGYYEGDNYFTRTADAGATLNTNATVACTVTLVKTLACDFSALFTPNLTVTILKNHTAVLDVNASILMTISKIAGNQSTLDSIVALSLQGDRGRTLDSTLSSSFTQSAQIQKILNANSTLNTEFTIVAEATLLGAATEASAALTAQFTQSAVVSKTMNTDADLAAEVTTSITASRTRGISHTFLAEVQITAQVGELQSGACNFATLFSPTVTCVALRNHTAILDSVSTVSCVITKTASFDTTLNTQFNASTAVSRSRQTSSDLAAASSVSTSAIKTAVGIIQFTSNISITVNAGFNKSFNSNLSSNFTFFSSRWTGTHRPANLLVPAGQPGRRVFSNSIVKFGSHALGGDNSKLRMNSSTGYDINDVSGDDVLNNYVQNNLPNNFGTNDSIGVDFWINLAGGESNTRRIFEFNFGPAVGLYNRKIYANYTRHINNQWTFHTYASPTQPGLISASQLNTNQWYHIALIWTANEKRLSVYVDGSRVITTVFGTAPDWLGPNVNGYANDRNFITIGDSNASYLHYIDEIRWFRNYTFGKVASDTTITVPTTAYLTEDTYVNNIGGLYHLNNDYLDDTKLLSLTSAQITATATVTAQAGKSTTAQATLNTEFTVSAQIGEIEPADVSMNTVCSLTVVATRIQPGTSNLNASASLTVSISKITGFTITQNSAFTVSNTITRIKQLFTEFTAIATELATVVKIGQGLITMDSVAQLTTEANRTAFAESNQLTQFGITAQGDRIRFDTVNTQSEFNLNALNSRIRALNSSQNSSFTVTAATDRIRSTVSTLSSEFAIICESLPIKQLLASLHSNFAVSSTLTITRTIQQQFNCVNTMISAGIKAVDGVSALQSQLNLNTQNSRLRNTTTQFDVIATELITVARIGQGLITMDSVAAINGNAVKTVSVTNNQSRRIAKTVTASAQAQISAAQSKFGGGSILMDGNLDALLITPTTEFQLGLAPFTVEAWVYPTGNTNFFVWDARQNSVFGRTELALGAAYQPATNNFGINLVYDNTIVVSATVSPRFEKNIWTHIACQRESGQLPRLYVNGVVYPAATSVDTSSGIGTLGIISIGDSASSITTSSLTGYMDEIRVSTGIRYATTGFTPQEVPFESDQNTLLLIHGDSTIQDDVGPNTTSDPAVAQITISINRIKQTSIICASNFTQTTNAITNKDVVINTTVVTTQSTQAQKTVSAISLMSTLGGFSMSIKLTRSTDIDLDCVVDFAVSGQRIRYANSNLQNSITLTILAGKAAVAQCVMNTTVTQNCTAGVLRLDDIILYIKTETRSYSINNEQRSYAIREENRLYTIEE